MSEATLRRKRWGKGWWLRVGFWFMAVGFVLGMVGLSGGLLVLWRYTASLPSYDHLVNYRPPVTSRMHAGDGELLAEFARERRLFVPYERIPKDVVNAFLAAEDRNFFEHRGVDTKGVMRAVWSNVGNLLSGRRLEGASTITQQVAKNFLLSSEVSYERKLKEFLLALRLERTYEKERILELYLNEIYLGGGSYGVASAGLTYFGKTLGELRLSEAAYLGALPKGPNNYHPRRNPERAKARRNWVLGRMAANGYVSAEDAEEARGDDLLSRASVGGGGVKAKEARYFVDRASRDVSDLYGGRALLEGGLSIRTSLDTRIQGAARRALRRGLTRYDMGLGKWRGPWRRLEASDREGNLGWEEGLSALKAPKDLAPWRAAAVLGFGNEGYELGFEGGGRGRLLEEGGEWALKGFDGDWGDLLGVGDVVWVEEETFEGGAGYGLRRIPRVNGALVALDPHTGRVLAMVGGLSFELSEFNRAVQAKRQPGSAFKPFVYSAALDMGKTPASLVLDAPFVLEQSDGSGWWKPLNYAKRFYGPSPLRLGIERSRNLMTVRLAQELGVSRVMEYTKRFDVLEGGGADLSLTLGSGETTLLRMVAAYATFVNGGYKIEPTLVDRIQDRRGRTIFRQDERECRGCASEVWRGGAPPVLHDERERVLSEQTAYQMTSMLEGVVRRGSGRRASIGGALAGKTGTTNDARDVWFVGFTADLVAGVYIGYDVPRTLGDKASGGTLAAPVFGEFMKEALGGKEGRPFLAPGGLRFVRVDLRTGEPSYSPSAILEAFRAGTEPDAALSATGGETKTTLRSGSVGGGGGYGGGEDEVGKVEIGEGTGGLY